MSSKEFKIICGAGVADVLQEVDRLVQAAHQWVNSDECLRVYKVEMTRALWNDLQDRITAMELSFHRNFKKLIQFGAFTGEINLYWDSPRSLVGVQSRTGFTIGLIAHHYYVNGEKTPLLTWSLHS